MIPIYSTYLKKYCQQWEEPFAMPLVGPYNFPEKRRNSEGSVDGNRTEDKRRQPLVPSDGAVRHGTYGSTWLLGEAWPRILSMLSSYPVSGAKKRLPFWLLRKSVILREIEIARGGISLSCGWEKLQGWGLLVEGIYQKCHFTWDQNCWGRQVPFVRLGKSVNKLRLDCAGI